jgi:hypothetical protein
MRSVSGTGRGFGSPARTQILTLWVIAFRQMRCLIIILSLLTKVSFGQINGLTECFSNQTDQAKCLKFGHLGFETDDLTFKRISKRVETIVDKADTSLLAYILPTQKRKVPKEFKLFKSSFLEVTKVNGQIQSLQLYGYSKANNLDFYGINLGTTTTDLIKSFGQPTNTRPFIGIKGEIWEYGDKRYSFVVKNDIVVIIKISRTG